MEQLERECLSARFGAVAYRWDELGTKGVIAEGLGTSSVNRVFPNGKTKDHLERRGGR